jgi:uncharacterized protein
MALGVFLVLTFAVSWTIFGTVDPRGGLDPLFLVGVFAPGIVAVTVTAVAEGRHGVRQLLGRIARVDVGMAWYAFAVLYMAAIKLGAAAAVRLSTGAWPEFGQNIALIPFAIIVSTPVQAGEEIGWRGYALPRLGQLIGMRAAAVLLGLVWAFWHLPLFYASNTGTTGQSFPVYLAQVTALSVAMAWLYGHARGSLLLVMLMHSAINQVTFLVPAAVEASSHPWTLNVSAMSWFTLALLWVTAAYFLWRMPNDAAGVR